MEVLKHILIGIICGISVLLISLLPLAEFLELKGYDLLHFFQDTPYKTSPIVLVAIDEPSFAELNIQWPWPRKIHAQLITTLKKSGAKVIAFDILFVEPSNPKDDEELANAIKNANNIVLASDITVITDKQYIQEMVIEPLPILGKNSKTGLVSLPLDRDYVVRRIPTLRHGQRLFAEQIAALFTGADVSLRTNAYISYSLPPGSFTRVSYYQALEADTLLPNDFFKDKIVIVGKATIAPVEPDKAQGDYFATPFLFSHKSQEGLMSGMDIHAYIVNNFLNNEFVIPLTPLSKGFLIILAGLCGSLLNIRWRPLLTGIIIISTVIVYCSLAYILFKQYMIWLPTFTVVVSMSLPYAFFTINAYYTSERKKRQIKKAFSHYLSPAVLEDVLKNPDKLQIGGRRVEATILFSDIAGFTALSEQLSPETIATLINRYMSAMTKIIIDHKGTIDKFIGDAIMAFWGAPLPDDMHAVNACKTAVAMQKRMNSLRDEFRSVGLPEISIRIGLNTGIVIAGNMGSDDLFDYTVLGDAVNLASRLEGANKTFGTNILISSHVYEQAKDYITARSLGFITVRGKEEKVEVFELIDAI